jgi:outer membrane protein assembly factor BamB
MFDAVTGNYICSIGNVTQTERRADATAPTGFLTVTTGATGTAVYGKDGSILRYNIVNLGNTANPQRYLQVWNTTQAIWYHSPWISNNYWMWRPGLNVTYDGTNGFTLNASIPVVQGSILAVREDQYVIGGTAGKNNGTYVLQGNLWALNLDPTKGAMGSLLWNITFTPPQAPPDVTVGTNAGVGGFKVDPEDGVFLFSSKQTMQRWGYSLTTGQLLWGPTASEPAMNFYSMDYDFYGAQSYIYNGMLLSIGYGGVLIAYNITTGQILWNYTATNVGFESPYGNYPLNIAAIADGKLYLISGEHSITQPMWRGFLRCVNATDGTEIWKIMQFGADGAANLSGMYVVMADGYVVGLNQYDSQIYCYGTGPSATTVEAPMTAITAGSSAIIQGTVMDISAGTKHLTQAADFPNGVPAVSDASQEAWMEYVYEQQGMPTNATGVPVSLDAIDPNGNYIHIGNATSDPSGTYSYLWNTPDIPGKYTVTATFAGSAAYYSSYAETAVGVSATPATPAPTATPLSEATIESGIMLYTAIAAIAIIIAIAIVGVLMLRKKP